MATYAECQHHIGNWVQFRTPWGMHQGIISAVNPRAVLVRVPRQYAPALASHQGAEPSLSDEQRLDLALTGGGFPGYRRGFAGPGYAGRGWGYPGWGAWAGGWWLWWLAFATFFLLAFLF